jgi:hypothetical protein
MSKKDYISYGLLAFMLAFTGTLVARYVLYFAFGIV